jgi:hypothetical protein
LKLRFRLTSRGPRRPRLIRVPPLRQLVKQTALAAW